LGGNPKALNIILIKQYIQASDFFQLLYIRCQF
jgi:hypothetical protein